MNSTPSLFFFCGQGQCDRGVRSSAKYDLTFHIWCHSNSKFSKAVNSFDLQPTHMTLRTMSKVEEHKIVMCGVILKKISIFAATSLRSFVTILLQAKPFP